MSICIPVCARIAICIPVRAQCGLYDSAGEMRKFLTPMCAVLAGSVNDAVVAGATRDGGEGEGGAVAAPRDARFEASADAMPVIQGKRMMCEVLLVLADIRIEWRISQFLARFKDGWRRGAAATAGLGAATAGLGAPAFSEPNPMLRGASGPPGAPGLGQLDDGAVEDFRRAFAPDASEASLDLESFFGPIFGGRSGGPSLVLMDLTRYGHAPLVIAAFGVLTRSYSQVRMGVGGGPAWLLPAVRPACSVFDLCHKYILYLYLYFRVGHVSQIVDFLLVWLR